MLTGLSFLQALPRSTKQERFRTFAPTRAEPQAISLLSREVTNGFGIIDPATCKIELAPFGNGKPGQSFQVRVWGWIQLEGSKWCVPKQLVETTATLGSAALPDGSLLADYVEFRAGGSKWIEFDFSREVEHAADSANTLWRLLPA